MVLRHARHMLPPALLFLAAATSALAEDQRGLAFGPTAGGAAEPAAKVPADAATHQPTRFVIGLEKEAKFDVSTLANPNRVIVELPEMKLQLPEIPEGQSSGLVDAFRAGVSAPGQTRVVIDVKEPVVVKSAKLEKVDSGPGQRLAIEIVPAGSVTKAVKKPLKSLPYALGAAGLQPPSPRQAERPEVKAAKAFKPVIVIDPGHGGFDSGATKNGTIEKDVVLAFSLRLKKKLEESGRYRVLMTRSDDTFIELGERVAFGERNKANLFIAVHADYADNQASGATIFSLRESTAHALAGAARKEAADHALSATEAEKVKKAGDGSDVDAVRGILGDLARREVDTNKERTDLFQRAVVEYMGETTKLRDEPEQEAGFRVLKTAQFPSVLIELAYVTNKQDAAQLNSDEWRDKVSDSIKTAVETYFSQQVARLPM